jgi:hypothetical protein
VYMYAYSFFTQVSTCVYVCIFILYASEYLCICMHIHSLRNKTFERQVQSESTVEACQMSTYVCMCVRVYVYTRVYIYVYILYAR